MERTTNTYSMRNDLLFSAPTQNKLIDVQGDPSNES